MAEYYDVYEKERWRDPSSRLTGKFSPRGKKGFAAGGAGGVGRNAAIRSMNRKEDFYGEGLH